MKIPSSAEGKFGRLLAELESSGRLHQVKGRRYAVSEKIDHVAGRLSLTRRGDGFVISEEGEAVFVRSASLDSAMDGDRVVVRIGGRRRGKHRAGGVVSVLERAHATLVGEYRRSRSLSFVVPRDPRIFRDVLIPRGKGGGASPGEVVVVRILGFGDGRLNPTGAIERVLGRPSEPGVDILTVMYGHGLSADFSPEVEAYAEEVGRNHVPEAEQVRIDRTELHAFTIDPADAKDHDDALSVTMLGAGRREIGVHIADVSHFVRPGTPLDAEALRRGTSVYLVDRVVPMLPELLSSNLCSLRPGEPRPALSLFITLSSDGRVVKHRFERTTIRSRHRLHYRQVQRVLDGRKSIDSETDEAILELGGVARVLRQRREERGALDFDLPETRVELGPDGVPIDVREAVRLESHRLIEEFMLLANGIVAERAAVGEAPLLYRVHEPPGQEELDGLRALLATLGHALPKGEIRPRHLQFALERVEGAAERRLVSTAILRAMRRARYSVENLGHYGLSAESYTHFTSPIRRYPDLVAHRAIASTFLDEEPVPDEWRGEALAAVAERSSERERIATEAERESVTLKKIEFMEKHLGSHFAGTISGVASFGFFVLLDDFPVEGLVHVRTLTDDYYVFREGAHSLVGERTARRFRVGDGVGVSVVRADKEERQLDFLLQKEEGGPPRDDGLTPGSRRRKG